MSGQSVVNALRSIPAEQQVLQKSDFDLTNATANQRSKIASYQAGLPLTFDPRGALRVTLTVVEEFTTNNTGGDTETFPLSNDLLETANTTDFLLYDDGSRVSADSVDYANDAFDYTDSGTGSTLHAHYVARDPVQISVEKSAPSGRSQVSETVFDEATSLLHSTDQNKEPPRFEFGGRSGLTPVVPSDWSIDVYADGATALAWDDSDTANPQSTQAVNALLSIPVRRSTQDVDGLKQAVKQDVIG